MNYISKKALDELELGDIISTEPTIGDSIFTDKEKIKEHIVNFVTICPNQNISPTGDIHCFGYKHWRDIPRYGKVYYFGKSDDERFWTKERKEQESRKLFESIKHRFDMSSISKLRNAFCVKLFGKRGYYSESGERQYLPNCYWVTKQLAKILSENDSKVVSVETRTYDEIDTDYSRRYETECYGTKTTDITIKFENGVEKMLFMA